MFAFIFFSVYFLLLFSTIIFMIVEFDIVIQFSMDYYDIKNRYDLS